MRIALSFAAPTSLGGAGITLVGCGAANDDAGTAGAGGSSRAEAAPVKASATGTGPHQVVIETNSDRGISEGTIFRPKDLGGAERYPIFIGPKVVVRKMGSRIPQRRPRSRLTVIS